MKNLLLAVTCVLLSLNAVAVAQTDDSGWINNPYCYAYGNSLGDSVRVYVDYEHLVVRMDGTKISQIQVYPTISDPGFTEQNMSPVPGFSINATPVPNREKSGANAAHQFYQRWQERKDELFRTESDPERVAEILYQEILLEMPDVSRRGNTLLLRLPESPISDEWTIEAPSSAIPREEILCKKVEELAACLQHGSFVSISSRQDDIIPPEHPNFNLAIEDVRLAKQIGRISRENWIGRRLSYEVARQFNSPLSARIIRGEG